MTANMALAPTRGVLDIRIPLSGAKLPQCPRQPAIRLTERQQMALALRESERLAAANDYHDELSDSHSSDAESEDAFSSVQGKRYQTLPSLDTFRRDSSRTPQQRAGKSFRNNSRHSGAHSPVKSDLVDSLDSTAINLLPANTPSTSDICSAMYEQPRWQRSCGSTPDPVRAVSDRQTDRDSDADDEASQLHPLNQRLWSSNSDDSTTAAVSIPVDPIGGSCAKWHTPNPLASHMQSKPSNATCSNQQSILPCKRHQDDSYIAGFRTEKRHRSQQDPAGTYSAEAADMDSDVIARLRRRQEKLGGCKAASRHLPAASTPKQNAAPGHQHHQSLLSMRRPSTRPAAHTVILQESDPFAEACGGVTQLAPPLRVRIRMPYKAPSTSHRGTVHSSHHHHPRQQTGSSPKASGTPSPSSTRDEAKESIPLHILSSPSHPSTPAGFTSKANAASPSTLPSQPSYLPRAGQQMNHSGDGLVVRPLPFGSPAVVRQFDASFFSSPTINAKTATTAAATSSAGSLEDVSPTVISHLPLAIAIPSGASAVATTTRQSPQIVTLSPVEGSPHPQPPSHVFKIPPVQQRRLKLRPPSSDALPSKWAVRATSVGPPPPFLERHSPLEPPAVVTRARRSRVAVTRSSFRLWTDRHATADGSSPAAVPCSSSGGSKGLRSCGAPLRSGASLAGSISSASLYSLDDLPCQHARPSRFKAGGLNAACDRLRQLYPSMVPTAEVFTAKTAATQPLIAADSSAGSSVQGLLAQVSRSAEGLQRRQQAEGLLLQDRMDCSGSAVSREHCSMQLQPRASVAAGCVALLKGQIRCQFPRLPALSGDDSIADQWDDLTARQALEYSTMRVLRDWIGGGR